MPDARDAPGRAPGELTQTSEPFRYPQDHVAAIVDSPEQLTDALGTLTGGGFLESEITVLAGPKEAERLDASTGRTGLMHHVLRVADRLGMLHKEMEVKERYEQALRDDGHVVLVLAPTEDRKRLAADVLRHAGGYFVKFFGRFTIEVLAP
jgi:hypothetical protein